MNIEKEKKRWIDRWIKKTSRYIDGWRERGEWKGVSKDKWQRKNIEGKRGERRDIEIEETRNKIGKSDE